MYVCDESTASIDEGSNATVHDALLSLPATVFFVCHRLEVTRPPTLSLRSLPCPCPLLALFASLPSPLHRHTSAPPHLCTTTTVHRCASPPLHRLATLRACACAHVLHVRLNVRLYVRLYVRLHVRAWWPCRVFSCTCA